MTTSTTTTARIQPVNNAGFLKKNATQLVIPLSLIVGISGVMMFFHLGEDLVKDAHEWLGLAFVVAMGLHIARNLKPMLNVINSGRGKVFIVLSLIAMAAFVFAPGEEGAGGNPFKQTTTLVMNAKISDAAPVFGLSAEEMGKRLSTAAKTQVTASDTIQSIAGKSHLNPAELLAAIIKK